MLIVFYLCDKYLILFYSVKIFENRQVIGIKKFIIWVVMSDFRIEKYNLCGDLGKFYIVFDYVNS